MNSAEEAELARRAVAGDVHACEDDEDAPTDAFGFTDGAGIANRGGGSLGLTFNGDMGVRRGRSDRRTESLDDRPLLVRQRGEVFIGVRWLSGHRSR